MLNPIPTVIFFTLHILSIQSQTHTSNHSRCPPFRCDHIDFPFPFSDQNTFGSGTIDCGFPGYQILCDEEKEEESTPVPILMVSTQPYQVKNIFLNQSYDEGVVNLITLVNTDLIRDRDINTASCHSFRNFTSPSSGLLLPDWNINLTFFKCPSQFAPPRDFLDQTSLNYTCNDEQSRLYLGRYVNRSQMKPTERSFNNSITPRDCNLVMLPLSSADINVSSVNNGDIERSQLSKVLAAGFPLQWKSDVDCENCIKKKGRCGFDRTKVVCLCDDGCNNTNSSKCGGGVIFGEETSPSATVAGHRTRWPEIAKTQVMGWRSGRQWPVRACGSALVAEWQTEGHGSCGARGAEWRRLG